MVIGLMKTTSPVRLLESLEESLDVGPPVSSKMARHVVQRFRDFLLTDCAAYRLTAQEGELLNLLVDGHHYKTAASAMGISVNTVSFHVKNIYRKLQVHSKTEAVAKAIRERLV